VARELSGLDQPPTEVADETTRDANDIRKMRFE
jgi:hypothetical protein